jgi:glycosyltransferase involved in cell wall biosynthesis
VGNIAIQYLNFTKKTGQYWVMGVMSSNQCKEKRMHNKIAFFRTEAWPYANVKMVEVLNHIFPEYEISVFEIYDWVKSRFDIVAINALEVLRVYGWDIVTKKKHFKQCFWRTSYIFRQIKQHAEQILSNGSFMFSFQMQSIFDASKCGIPHFIYTDHTHLANLSYPNFDKSKLFAKEWIDLERTIYANATINFVWSHNIGNSLIDDYHCDPSKVVCAYIGSNAMHQEISADSQKYRNKKILFVGIDWERKGGPDLVKAFELVRQKHPDANLTIVGCSPSVDTPNCRVVGRVPVNAVGKFFSAASVFCLPTHLEPFGIVFIESMSSKTPIVATNVGAIPDLVRDGETGFLVAPGDVWGISEALITLISDPEKSRKFGEKGYQIAQEKYSWDAIGALMKKHITTAIAKQ